MTRYVPRDRLVDFLSRNGFVVGHRCSTDELWCRGAGVSVTVNVPRDAQLAEDTVRGILQDAGMSPNDIEQFVQHHITIA